MYQSFFILFLLFSLQGKAQESTSATSPAVPFAFGDFSWVPGGYAPSENPLATKYFVPELRIDNVYHKDFNNPKDHTISGSSEEFRSDEFQTTQIGVGGDVTYKDVGFRLMTQFGMYATTTPRNDSSPSRGQWDLANAYRYISEAYATYHLDAMNGVNIQTGIFMSYVGLWSYYNFDNWTYQPSYVSSNTPWFFNGMRIQTFPSDKLKIEYWLINGWQSYGMFNEQPGVGMQVLYRPNDSLSVLGNQYYGADTLNTPGRTRMHTDDSFMMKYYDNADNTLSKAAFSVTLDAGCEEGGGVNCSNQYFLGFMAYNRLWFNHDHYGLTFGGGYITNKGRYLVLVPPINGATASSGDASGSFTANPGDAFNAWDLQLTGDYMPTPNLTFRLEYTYRWASVPYFSGPGGVTPPGGNQGTPGSIVAGWTPDLVKDENIATAAMMVRF
ncbi:MAG: outer membrane beta-barrel protein [Pseudobdellovibrio sp.]